MLFLCRDGAFPCSIRTFFGDQDGIRRIPFPTQAPTPMLGIIGKVLILVAIVSCTVSGILFFRSARDESQPRALARTAAALWWVMTGAVVTAFGVLVYLSITHAFEYAYIYSNTARDLELKFLISAAWAGQEGSFLLWIVLNALTGVAVIHLAGAEYRKPAMAVIALCQVFLISMIAGIQFGPLPIGSSPFATLAEKFPDAPMIQAGIIPADGQGLNDLLRNYWMVIHPPILFSGFASMIVPFAFAISALWKRRYTEWVRPALPWTLFAVMALGVGIVLGGYWAYVTLSFGGYWAWDPVENSSLVPWLVGVAALHTMIVQKRSGHSQKASLFLSIGAYMLVVYSTFLTRSGILGEVSVHSFVDLGLYNQLLLWILAMGALGFGLFAIRYRELPVPNEEPELLSREFMIFSGAMLLCALGAVVLVGTSSPILGRIFRDSPSVVPLEFYNTWSMPLTVVFMFLAGMAQLFWWHKMNVETINRVLVKPVIFSVVGTILLMIFSPFREVVAWKGVAAGSAELQTAGIGNALEAWWSANNYGLGIVMIVFVSFFALFGNGAVLWRIARGNLRLAGGAMAHVGLAIMVLGIIVSSGLSSPVYRGGVQIGDNRDNFILARGQTLALGGYTFSYTGQAINDEGHPFYRLDITDPYGRQYDMNPVVYLSNKGQWIQNPDVRKFVEKDLFLAVSPNVMFDQDGEGRQGTLSLARGDSALVGEGRYSIRFREFQLNVDPDLLSDSTDLAVGAAVDVREVSTGRTQTVRPVYMIMQDRSVQYVQNTITDWGITVAFTGMNVDNGEITLGIDGVRVTPEDWLVVQAYEKPLISLVWIGFIILTAGFVIAILRRAQDVRMNRERALKLS